MTTSNSERAAARTKTIMRATLALAQEGGYAALSMEAVAARAGVGKHTIYRRWPSKGLLFLDSLLTLNEPALDYPDTGDVMADLRRQAHAAVDLLGSPPWGPLYRSLVGEAQHDPLIAAGLNERFVRPQTEKTFARLSAAQEQGQIAEDYDIGLGMAILSGPLYYRLLITDEPLTHAYVDQVLEALFAGMRPRT
ncbi:TetR/AcrR family transcriptional regulator [Nocardiopsis alborubida]|nr:TetR/AcrR family transcriptional regulator [Nocardiopsis alborubida]